MFWGSSFDDGVDGECLERRKFDQVFEAQTARKRIRSVANTPSQLISSRYKPRSFMMLVSMLKAVLSFEGHVAWWMV